MARQSELDFQAPPDRSLPGGCSGPLPYELKVSKRARRVTLRVLPGRGLVVTIPPRFARRDVPAAVEARRDWALRALRDSEAGLPEICREWPPRRLELAAIGRRVLIAGTRDEPVPPPASSLGYEEVLPLTAEPDERAALASEVAAWLKPQARRHLGERLATLGERHGLGYERLAIRGQRTLWGSYSSSGTLSLNYKLLFLRPALVDYVLLHELAHTRVLDHSRAFWVLLERLCPGARTLDTQLRDAGRHVPPWLELAR